MTSGAPKLIPDDFAVPAGLEHEQFRLRMLAASDVEADYEAVMASQARLRAGSPHGWPREGFTLAENLADLQRHEQEFHDRVAFAYTMVSPDESRVLGCVYINPPAPDGESAAAAHDAQAYMWVRDEHHPELAGTLFEAVQDWLAREWPFQSVRYIRTEYYQGAAR